MAGVGALVVHVPSSPGKLHIWFGPRQRVLQQTPLVQKPLWHCVSPVQAEPFCPPLGVDVGVNVFVALAVGVTIGV